jgi:tetratricopeptide (TPR) repeat protein
MGGSDLGCGFLASHEVQDWFEGQLNPRRSRAFEMHQASGCRACNLAAADRAVFLDVAARGLLHSERKHYDRTQAIVKAHLRQELASRHERSSEALSGSWRQLAGLAVAAMLVLAVASPFLLQEDVVPGAITMEGMRIEPMPFSKPFHIRGAEQPSELWTRAESAYVAGDYAAAERLLAAISRQAPQDHDALMYRGVSLVLAGRQEEAIAVLRQAQLRARELGVSELTDSFWLGLALLEQGERAAAREELLRVRDGGGANAERAARLLASVD